MPVLHTLVAACANRTLAHLQDGQWPHLRRLGLSKNRLDTAAIQQLVLGQRPLLEELNTRRAILPSVTDLGHGKWPLLKSIELRNMDLASEHVPELTSTSQAWPLLSHVGLSKNHLNYQDLPQLAACWPQLTSLDLSGNNTGTDGVSILVQSYWSGLQHLALGACALTDVSL